MGPSVGVTQTRAEVQNVRGDSSDDRLRYSQNWVQRFALVRSASVFPCSIGIEITTDDDDILFDRRLPA